MKRKIILIAVSVVLLALVLNLAACGSKKDPASAQTSAANETDGAAAESKIKVTLVGGKVPDDGSKASESGTPAESGETKSAGTDGPESTEASEADKILSPLESIEEITDEAEANELVKKYSEVGELKPDAKTPGVTLIVADGERVVSVPLKYSFPEWLELQKKPVFLDFWAAWCGPCQVAGPYVNGFAPYFGDRLLTVKANADDAPNYAQAFSVQALPTFMLYQDGKAYQVKRGFNPNDEKNIWHLVEEMLKK